MTALLGVAAIILLALAAWYCLSAAVFWWQSWGARREGEALLYALGWTVFLLLCLVWMHVVWEVCR